MEWTPLGPFEHLRAGLLPSGVVVLWAPADGLTRARLTFRVGVLDEALVERGTTHLVEHLAHAELGLPAHANAGVSGAWTEFDVRGTPDQVEHHLVTVARSLRNLPVGRIAAEVEVLRLEHARRAPDPWAWLREKRHGVRGAALVAARELALFRDDAASVAGAERARQWARTWFTAQNAVLWVQGPEPAPWHLDLPVGHRPARPRSPVSDRTRPAWFTGASGVVAFSAVAADQPAALAAWWWLHRRLEDRLRLQDAAVYGVDMTVERTSPERLELFMAAQATADRTAAVFRAVQEVVAGACTEPLPASQLADWQRDVEDRWREPRLVDDALAVRRLDAVAGELLLQPLDRRDPVTAAWAVRGRDEAQRDRARDLTPDRVRDELRVVMGTALLQVPEEVDGPADVPHLSPLSEHGLRTGTAFAAAGHLAGGQRLLVSERGVMLEPAPAVRLTVLWSDCVLYAVLPDGRRGVHGLDGTVVEVDRLEWARGDAAVSALDAAAPAHLVVPLTGGDVQRRRGPRVLSGVASISTGPLVALVLGLSLSTAVFAGFATSSDDPVFAWAFTAVVAASAVVFAHGLVLRLRVPRSERTTLSTRARTSMAVAFDEALARGTRGTAVGIAVGAWVLAVAVLVAGVPTGRFYWPGLVIAGLAVRATHEARRRPLR